MVQLFFILLSYNEGMIYTWRIFSLALLVVKTNDMNDLIIYPYRVVPDSFFGVHKLR